MDERLQQYFLGELTGSEQAEFLEKIKNDESLRKQFYHFQNLNALMQLLDHPDDEKTGKAEYSAFIGRIKKYNLMRRFIRVSRYAAAIAMLIFSTWWLTIQYYEHTLTATTNTLYVPTGQRAQLTLQDGTTVWLNARSTLVYPSHFFGKDRRVKLAGEAFFEVAKDSLKPFIVSTAQADINVLGTKFNVYSYPDNQYMEASLIEGSVRVSRPGKSHESVTLLPNQQVHVDADNMNVKDIGHFSYFMWKDGIYSFENESFKDIINKLELYYDVKIIVKNPSILNFEYTGKFRQRDGVYEILKIIRKIHRFNIEKNEDGSVITLSR